MLPLPWCLQNNIRLFSSCDFRMAEAMSHNLYASKANVVSDPWQPIAESHRILIMRIRERKGGEMTRCNETRWITKYIRKKVSFFATSSVLSAPISGRRDLYIWGFAAFGESKRAPYRNWVQTRQCENIVKCFTFLCAVKRVRTCKVFCFIQNVIFLVLFFSLLPRSRYSCSEVITSRTLRYSVTVSDKYMKRATYNVLID